jgi:hypothetical protein
MRILPGFLMFCFCSQVAMAGEMDPLFTGRDTVKAPEYTIIGKNRYMPARKWLIAGPALSVNRFTSMDGSLGVDYHMMINDRYYQAGVMRGKEYDGLFPQVYSRLFNEMHLGVGIKEEAHRLLYAFFLGPSYSAGEYFDPESGEIVTFGSIGLHTNIEVIYKPVYDVGIGTNVFVDANFKYTVAGVRLVFFFSDAFRGKQ